MRHPRPSDPWVNVTLLRSLGAIEHTPVGMPGVALTWWGSTVQFRPGDILTCVRVGDSVEVEGVVRYTKALTDPRPPV